MNAHDETGNEIGGWGRPMIRQGVVALLTSEDPEAAVQYHPTEAEFDAALSIISAEVVAAQAACDLELEYLVARYGTHAVKRLLERGF